MAAKPSWGTFPPYKKASLPVFPGMMAVLGPGVIFMTLAQGSGELTWWLYIVAKYGLTFIFLLIPACLLWACSHPEAMGALPSFLQGLFIPPLPMPRAWAPSDATKLLTAITFAGLGGFWTLLYSYWIRDKGIGLAHYMGRITGPITGKPEVIPESGFIPENNVSIRQLPRWRRFLLWDVGIGVGGNLFTTLLTCLLAYEFLFPKGLLPEHYELAVVQSRFFEASWGPVGKMLFLVVAAAFLSDTWLVTVDGVSRMHTDFVYGFFPRVHRIPVRSWYLIFVLVLTAITAVTVLLNEPGPLILLSAVIGFIGTVLFSIALIFLNHVMLPPYLPPEARPGLLSLVLLLISCLAYLALAMVYILSQAGVL